ncbi:MAG: Hsp70 family protein, partial [Firmicutes bacterium]|nr:Hsp70 family protein [Bacillota bacterium]
NTTLGRFQLDGLPAAPRGVPQIEVTFDIDANGIVNVTAKDKGTGREQHITITSSTNMSKEDIDRAVKDAEKYAAEDKKKRDLTDAKNEAESMIFQTEKSLSELGDKVSDSEKQTVNSAIESLRSAVTNGNLDEIKAKTEELQKAFYPIAERIYSQNGGQQQGADPNGGNYGGGSTNDGGSANGGDGNTYYDTGFEDNTNK